MTAAAADRRDRPCPWCGGRASEFPGYSSQPEADRPALVEAVAEAIYDAMREHDPEGQTRPWIPRGNSLKQEEARRRARAALTADTASTDRLRVAAERVIAWADHHEPWNPSGDFAALRAALADAARTEQPDAEGSRE